MLADRIRAATGGGGISLTYVDAATSTSSSLTAPGGIASGDLAIYMDLAWIADGSIPTAVTPSGFTNVLNKGVALGGGSSAPEIRCMVSYKILSGSETTITGMNDANENKAMLVYRPSRAITTVTPLAGASWGQEIVRGNPSSQSKTLASLDVPLVYLGISYGFDSVGAFTTASPAFDATHSVGQSVFGRKLYNTAPQNHTIDSGYDGGGAGLFSGYIQVS